MHSKEECSIDTPYVSLLLPFISCRSLVGQQTDPRWVVSLPTPAWAAVRSLHKRTTPSARLRTNKGDQIHAESIVTHTFRLVAPHDSATPNTLPRGDNTEAPQLLTPRPWTLAAKLNYFCACAKTNIKRRSKYCLKWKEALFEYA